MGVLLSFSLLILGLMSGIQVLPTLAVSGSVLLQTTPAPIIDLMVVLILLTKGVRSRFK
jgi:hypothetical protein